MVRSKSGTLVLEIADEQIEVTLGETGRTLRGKTEETLRLPIGEHVLHVQIGETRLDTPEITVAKWEPVEIKVEKVGNRVRVMRGKEFLVAKELPRSKASVDSVTSLIPSAAQVTLDDPAFQKWMKAVAAMPPEEQVQAVVKKLRELNPDYDGNETHQVEYKWVTELKINPKEIKNIAPIRALARLRSLTLEGSSNLLADPSPLRGMRLTKLTISGGMVADLTPLRGMPLDYLNLSKNQLLSDLSPLRGMLLTKLRIHSTKVADLSPLKGMPLRSLECFGTRITDLSPLVGCTSLTDVNAGGTLVTADSVAVLKKALPNCKIAWTDRAKAAADPKSEISNLKSQISDSKLPPPAKAPFDAKQACAHQEAWAKHLGVPVEFENSIGMKFVLIPPGEFLMGASPKEVSDLLNVVKDDPYWVACVTSEGPQRRVTLTRPFYLGLHEVRQKDFSAVMGVNPSSHAATGQYPDIVERVANRDTTNHPVEHFEWNAAAEFCAKLSVRENLKPAYFRTESSVTPLDAGNGYRLPTEAEWEFACRAGSTTQFPNGDDKEDLARIGWFGHNSDQRTHAVGELNANPFGLFDMCGNVFEFVEDGWQWDRQGDSDVWLPAPNQSFTDQPQVDPRRSFLSRNWRVMRGGHAFARPTGARSSTRGSCVAHGYLHRNHSYNGFRVVRMLDAPTKMGSSPPINRTDQIVHPP